MPRVSIKERLKNKVKKYDVIEEEESLSISKTKTPSQCVASAFQSQSSKIMVDISTFQQSIVHNLGKLTKEDVDLEENEVDDMLTQLWKCRKSQLENVHKQVIQINHQLTYIIMMTRSIEEWLADDKSNQSIVGDYDLSMINSDLGEAYQILFSTESNLNHNYLSKFDGFGKINSTLVPEQ